MSLVWFALLWIGAAAHGLQSAPESDDLSRAATRDYQPLVFRAQIIGGAIWRPNSLYRPGQGESERWRTQWRVHCHAVRDAGQWRSVSSYSTLTVAGRIDQYLPGDELTVFGSFAKIREPGNPGQSDLREIFRAEHQFVFLRADSIQQLELNRRSWRHPIARLTAMAVRSIDRALHRYVPFGQAPLAAAWSSGNASKSIGTRSNNCSRQAPCTCWPSAACILNWSPARLDSLLDMRLETTRVADCRGYDHLALRTDRRRPIPPVLRAVFVVLAVCVARGEAGQWVG